MSIPENPASTPAGTVVNEKIDQANTAMHHAVDQISNIARPAAERIVSGAQLAGDKLASATTIASERLSETAQQLSCAQKGASEGLRASIRDKPLTAVCMALLAGIVLHWMMED